jgi:hypothetical protein
VRGNQRLQNNPGVIDVEVAFGLEADDEAVPATRRIDFAALRRTSKGAEIIFYEAKLFTNKEVKAKDAVIPPVIAKIEGYERLLKKHAGELIESYREVCGNLASLDGVRERHTPLLDIMREVSTNCSSRFLK